MQEEIQIRAEPQLEPHQCKFVVQNKLVDHGAYAFKDKTEAVGSSLAEEIFALGNVASLMVNENTVLITTDEAKDWREVGKIFGAAIRKAFTTGKELISAEFKRRKPQEQILIGKVNAVIQERINPAVASHGGMIELMEVKNNDVFLKMSGGCQGCGMAAVTLKQGVEEALKRELPEIRDIYDITDHSAGQNPYY